MSNPVRGALAAAFVAAGTVAIAGALALGPMRPADPPESARTALSVRGMTCGGCVAAVKIQLGRTVGVTEYQVSLALARAEVSYDPAQTTPDRIAESVSQTGFAASVVEPVGPAGAGQSTERTAATPPDATECGASCSGDCCKAHQAAAESDAPGLVSLAEGTVPLVSAFNAARARPRFLAILSPTCPACVHGAEAIRDVVLASGDGVDAFIVWAPMRAGDDPAAAASGSTIVSASNVRQYWDPGRRVGSALRRDRFPDSVARMKTSVPKEHFFARYLDDRDPDQPEWDIYLQFEPGVEWGAAAPAPAQWIRQVARFAEREGGPLVSLMWRDDYASPPVEGSLADELRKLVAATTARAGR